MAKQIVNEMATNLTLDSKSASQALKELTREVKNSSTEAKILESQYKASGDAVSASKAKYEGLQSTLEAQKTKIEALKSGLDNVNTSTKKGQDLQQYLNGELAKAERQYASYQGQLEKATQSYKYQESGLASLNDELKHSNSLTDARVQKLEAEGRTEEANKVKLEGLKNTQENYTKQLEIQKDELNKLAETGDKNTDSYKRQELRVEQMGAKLASTTSDIKHFNNTDIKPETKGLTSVKDKLNSLNDSLEGTRSHFKTIFMGNLIANGVTNALESIKDKFTDLIREGAEYNKEQQVMSATWDTLTGDTKKGQAMVDSVNSISTAFGQSSEITNELEQQFYHVFNQQGPTDTLTKSVLTMADTIGLSADETKRLGLNFTHMMSSTKLQLGDFNMITDQLPMYGEKLLEFERNQQNNQKLTMSQLRDQMSAGKISADDAEKVMNELGEKYSKASENMMSTTAGMERVISARGTALAGALTKPIMEAKNPLFGAVSKWVSDKNTENEFTKVGDSVSKSFSTITKAFGKQFKSSTFTEGADKFMKSLSTNIEKFGDYIAKHAGDITNFFKMTKELGGAGFGIMGSTLKIALPLLEDLGKFASKHPTTFKVLAGSILGLNLALKATLSTMAVFGKTKAVFGALSGLIIKPKVDGSGAKRELGIIGKIGKGIGKSVVWTGKLAVKSVLKSLELIGDATIKTGKALWWTAKLATKVFLKSLELLGGAVIKSGKLIGKGLVFTAKIATKGASLALAGLVKTAKVTGKGIKLAFNFLKANPLILLVTAITAVVIAFAELYKHNKKFRTFVNGIIKGAQDFFKGIGKWFGQAWKAVSGFFSKVMNFVKKDWKEILLFIVNPFAGAFALVYKHNAKFRKAVNNLVKDVVNFFKNMGKSIGNIFNSIFKNISKIYNNIKDFIGDTTHNIYKGWVNSWKSIFNFFGDTWKNIKKFGSNSINSLKGTFDDILGKIGKSFSNTWNGIKDGFKSMWNGMKDLAGKGINAVIKIPNAGISGINGLIHDFGGPKSALGQIPKVAFASGTGAFNNARRPINKPTLAVLNDGNDSPETGNKEALLHPNGQLEVVQGRNTERLLMPGTEVFNASELALLMGKQQFASGTGFLGSIWDGVKGAGSWVGKTAGNAWDGIKDATDKFTKMFGFITNAVAHPVKTLEGVFDPKSNSSLGNMMGGLATGTFKHVKTQATDWWKSLWSMASDEASGGGTSELLNKMVKAGTGKPYVWGATGPDSFDCSGLVQYALREMNKSFPHYSGDQWNASTPVSDPKAGDLAFFGPGGSDHVGVYSGNGKMFSAQSPQSSPNIGFANISDWSEPLAGYRRVPGLKSDDEKSSNSNPMASLIKGQVGGMFEWIKKFIAPTQDSPAEPAGDGVGRWRSDVTKALGKLGLSTSGSMISKVLKQIQTESGGNASAMGGNDGLADGNATGLMQVKPGTFRAYASAGHDNIMNGYDNILAGLAYAKNRYGSNLSSLGQGHGYANGGLITQHQIAEIGEGNKPEMIIPLDGMKSSRGFELLGKTAVAMASRDGQLTGGNTSDLSSLEAKFDQMLGFLSQLVSQGNNPTSVNAIFDKNDLYKKQANDGSLRNIQAF